VPRLLVLSIAALVTLGGIAGALYLGAWAFDVRRFTTHQQRLTRLLAREPTQAQLEQAFLDEGTLLVGSAEADAGLVTLSQRHGGAQAESVLASGRRHSKTQVYVAGDMVYFIHFDAKGVMRGFTLVSR
jgi:hypothetical protein